MASLCLLVVFPFLMAYAAASDLLTMTIPNRISLLLVGAFGVLAVTAGLGWAELADHAGAFAATLAVGFCLFCTGTIGGGDAKLAAATALWLGFGPLVDYLTAAAILGGILTLGILSVRQHPLPGFAASWPFALDLRYGEKGVPYGLALAGAALVVCPAAPLWRLVLPA
ncbi:peptidase [Methylobacterium terrae]|uniref:Peptidase n=1 Tax=Methylobacterium terrae TaxID=2202827 RepID=A0A2U8WIX5_9HYPH|nr:prepilin peptidase [Methylobacterium terrae]AWN46117.1 peptidase [Methylobacterium terrae]